MRLAEGVRSTPFRGGLAGVDAAFESTRPPEVGRGVALLAIGGLAGGAAGCPVDAGGPAAAGTRGATAGTDRTAGSLRGVWREAAPGGTNGSFATGAALR